MANHTPLTDQQIADIEQHANAATDGPWGVYQYGGDSLIEIAADLEDTGCGYRARRTVCRFDEEPLDNDPAHREWTAEEDWAQVQADAAYIAAMSPDVAAALVAEVRRLRAANAQLDRALSETIDDRDQAHEIADKLAYAVAPEEVIGEHSSMNCPWTNALELITPKAEVDKMRAVLADLAGRWEQMADHGDAAIGHFEGPAAATLNAEVAERGHTYRKAAADIRDVLRTGRVPEDLLTSAEAASNG
ncbi:hypothetical protein [Streptomyces sp. NPDC001492]